MEAEEDAVELDDSELTPSSLRLAAALHNYYLKSMRGESIVPDEDAEALAEQFVRLKTPTSTSTATSNPIRKGKEKCTDPEPELPTVMEVVEGVKAVRRRRPQPKRGLGSSQKMPDGRALKRKSKKQSGEQEMPGLGLDNGAEAGSSGSAT